MNWMIAVLLVLIAAAAILRLFYGNLYERAGASFERRFGLRMATVVRALGVLTLAAWIAVYVSADEEDKTPFGDLIPKLFEGLSDHVPKDRAP